MPTFPRVSVPHVPHHSPLNVNFIAHIIFITKLLQSAVAVYMLRTGELSVCTPLVIYTRHYRTVLQAICSCYAVIHRFVTHVTFFISFLFFPFFVILFFLSRHVRSPYRLDNPQSSPWVESIGPHYTPYCQSLARTTVVSR